jgi:predicted porin
MKKTLIATGVLALSAGAAHAQTTVTMYGLVDTGVVYSHVQGQNSRMGIENGLYAPSRLGFRGNETINSDLAIDFQLENGFNPDTGTAGQSNRLFGREAWVGFTSKSFGSVRMGRTTNLGQRWGTWIASPFGLAYGFNADTTTFNFDDPEFGSGRSDNSIYYESPKFAGVTLAGGFSFNVNGPESAGAGNNTRTGDLGVRYENGPLTAFAEYLRTENYQAAYGRTNPQSIIAAASYDFKVVKVFGGYSRMRDVGNNAGSTYSSAALGSLFNTGWVNANRNDDNAYSIGVSAPVLGGTVMVGYQALTSQKINNYGVAFMYPLSKRTSLHAFYAGGSFRDFNTGNDHQRQQAGLGIDHKF